MTDSRRLSSGYSDLGSMQFPPLAQAIVLTDRADGTKWLVSINLDAPRERLSINSIYSTIQRKDGVRVYEANDGPKMDEDGEFTLIIRSGRIGLDYIPFTGFVAARDDAPPYARLQTLQRKLFMNSLNLSTLHLGYQT